MANVENSNVRFLQGSQAALDELRASTLQNRKEKVIDGAFYLTNDTNRLYIGRKDGDLEAINEGIFKISSISELPDLNTEAHPDLFVGQFYYIEDIYIFYHIFQHYINR